MKISRETSWRPLKGSSPLERGLRFCALRTFRGLCILCPLALLLAVGMARGDEAPVNAPLTAVLNLMNGGIVAGTLQDSKGPARVGWLSPHFVAPFDFDVNAVNAIHFPLPPRLPKAAGDFRFELSAGDVLFGSLMGWEGSDILLEVPQIGRVRLKQSEVQRFYRWCDSADLVYLGPNGMTGWQPSSTGGKGWREEFGHLVTDQEASSLSGDFEIPARAVIEFDVSWKKKPDFAIVLGAGEADKKTTPTWRFEIWDGDLVIQGENELEADVVAVQKIASGAGRAHLIAYLDQPAGRCRVFSTTGETLADLKLGGGKLPALNGVRIDNKRGDLRLERLRIARWGGDLPREVQTDKPRVHRIDGSIIYGKITGYDAAAQEFIMRGDEAETRLAAAQIAIVVLALPVDAEPRAIRATYQDGSQLSGELLEINEGFLSLAIPGIKSRVRLPVAGLRSLISLRHGDMPPASADAGPVGTLDLEGLRLRGQLIDGDEEPAASCLAWRPLGSANGSPLRHGISGRILYREPPPSKRVSAPVPAAPRGGMQVVVNGRVAVGGAMRVGVAVVPGLAANANAEKAPDAVGPEADKARRALDKPTTVDFVALPLEDCLKFFQEYHELKIPIDHEALSQAGVELNQPITLKRAEMPFRRVLKQILEPAGLKYVIDEEGLKITTAAKVTNPRGAEQPALYLRSGDSIPCEILGIDESGIHFTTTISDATFVPHDKIKALELANSPSNAIRLTKSKRERLLMLPRMQKESQPTHLIHSRYGDYLRGRIVAMDERNVTVEIRLETKIVPRERIAQIIWLHADELDDSESKPVAAGAPAADGTRLQALRSDGIRITFIAERMAAATLSGKSDILGPCHVQLSQIDQLFLGGAIERAAAQLVYQQWKLHNAPEPKFALDDAGSGDGESGLESPLVGKVAPDFELPLLDGKKFHLADARGHVVILDFWATWCGPCLSAMPQVDRVAREFTDQGVRLIAINLEETPKQITSMLERHKFEMTVALDRDGGVAQKYQAQSIPQTVIIDREGKIARLYVGGGAHFEDQLREAVLAVLAPPTDPATDTPKDSPPVTP